MSKTLLVQELEKNLEESEKIIKLHKSTLRKNKYLKIVFNVNSFDYDKYVNKEYENKINRLVREIIPKSFVVDVDYRKTVSEEKYIKKQIFEFFYKEHNTIFPKLQNCDIKIEYNNNLIKIFILIEKYIYEICKKMSVSNKLASYLDSLFMESFEINLIEIENKIENIIVERKKFVEEEFRIKTINISIKKQLYSTINSLPRYIMDAKKDEYNNITICGAISAYKEIKMKKKEGKFFTFLINDTTSIIPVKLFSGNAKSIECGENLKDGDILALYGNTKFDDYSKTICFFANKIAECEIDYNSINTEPDYKKENDNYINVFPQDYKNEFQQDIFEENKCDRDDIFLGKIYVVFDLETTGLDTKNDKITEIGAMKIVDGKMTEIFHSMINPEMQISAGATEKSGITSKMVENAPTFEDVVGDFYKFTRNSVLVAHNAQFDISLISRMGKECLYNFDNNVVDTLILARQKLQNLKSYKLENLCKKLNISLIDAHRAMNDTIATANLFIKLLLIKEKL